MTLVELYRDLVSDNGFFSDDQDWPELMREVERTRDDNLDCPARADMQIQDLYDNMSRDLRECREYDGGEAYLIGLNDCASLERSNFGLFFNSENFPRLNTNICNPEQYPEIPWYDRRAGRFIQVAAMIFVGLAGLGITFTSAESGSLLGAVVGLGILYVDYLMFYHYQTADIRTFPEDCPQGLEA